MRDLASSVHHTDGGGVSDHVFALTHVLALRVFARDRRYDPGSSLEIAIDQVDLEVAAPGIGDSPAGQALARRHEEWARQLADVGDLWGWLLAASEETRRSLLAYCVARTVNAVRQPNGRQHALAHADQLATALGLDMATWWQPSRTGYLGRVPKARILEAVREGVSAAAADEITDLKKTAMAERAEQLLAGTGWLPAVLRPVAVMPPSTVPSASAA